MTAPTPLTRLDEIEDRLTQNALGDPHDPESSCRECDDARDLTVLVAFAREIQALEATARALAAAPDPAPHGRSAGKLAHMVHQAGHATTAAALRAALSKLEQP